MICLVRYRHVTITLTVCRSMKNRARIKFAPYVIMIHLCYAQLSRRHLLLLDEVSRRFGNASERVSGCRRHKDSVRVRNDII